MNRQSERLSIPQERLHRLRKLSKLLDSAIPLPGGYRIGLDGLIGLIPGIGDVAGGAASSYIIIESARLGASTATLLRMVFNVLLEMVVGLVPFLGDLFDFVWKANEKNLDLLEKQLHKSTPRTSAEHRLQATVIIILLILFTGILALAYVSVTLFLQLISAFQSP